MTKMTSEVEEMTSEVAEASVRSPLRRIRSRRKVRRRWQRSLLSWPPSLPFLLLLVLHNARFSVQQSQSSRLTLFDLDSDGGGPLDAHSVEKRKIGDVSLAVNSQLSKLGTADIGL